MIPTPVIPVNALRPAEGTVSSPLRGYPSRRLTKLVIALAGLAVPAMAANQTWTGLGSDANWATGANWSGGAAPGSVGGSSSNIATFNSAIVNTWGDSALNPIIIDLNRVIGGITFTGAAGDYFIGSTLGNTLRLNNNGIIDIDASLTSPAAVETINAPLALNGVSYNLRNNSSTGTLVIGGSVTGQAGGNSTLNLLGTNTGANTISGIISNGAGGTLGLRKLDAGAWTLSGVNTFTGVTRIDAGVLSVSTIGNGGVAGNLGAATSAAANLDLRGGTLQYTGSTASTDRGFTLTGTTSAIEVSAAGTNLTWAGASTGGGSLTKTGAGTLTLAAANGHTGSTTVNAGTLAYGVSNALASGAVNVNGGSLAIGAFSDTVGAVTLAGGGSITGTTGVLTGTTYNMQSGSVSAILGGAGAMVKSTSGTVVLSGANTFSGSVTVGAGVLRVENSSALGSTAAGTQVNSGAALELAGGIAIGAESVVFSGTGDSNGGAIRNVSGNNSLAGPVTIFDATGVHRINSDAGTLTLNGGISEAGPLDNKDLTFGGAGDIVVNGSITAGTGDMRLFKDGSGTLTLAGAGSNYDGATTISSGTLLMGASNVLPNNSAVTLAGGKLSTGGFSDSAGVFSVIGSGVKIIDFGSSASSILTFLNTINTALWSGRLEIWNWSGTIDTTGGPDQLNFTAYTGGSTFSPSQLTVQFYSGAGVGPIGNHGKIVNNELIPYLVPVPETRTVAGILLIAAMVGWRERRHFLRCPEARANARNSALV